MLASSSERISALSAKVSVSDDDTMHYYILVRTLLRARQPCSNETKFATSLHLIFPWLCRASFLRPLLPRCDLFLPQLIQDMWQTDPEARPSSRQVVARLEEMIEEVQ